MRFLSLLAICCLLAFGGDIKPIKSVPLSSAATDMVFRGQHIYASTSKGDIYQITKSGQAKKIYSLPTTQKALSLDALNDPSTVVAGGEDGYLYTVQNKILKASTFKTNSVIKKISLVSQNLVLIGLVSSQITLFDISKNKSVYSVQIGTSPLSDMALSSDKKSVVVVGEAGVVYIIDVLGGKIKKAFKNVNLDNIYKVDYQNTLILTAGQDRKSVLMSDSGVIKAKFDGEFLVYAAALSPSASFAAAALNEQSDISVFSTLTKSLIATAKGHNATLNRIIFMSENEFASCADENKILIWRIK